MLTIETWVIKLGCCDTACLKRRKAATVVRIDPRQLPLRSMRVDEACDVRPRC